MMYTSPFAQRDTSDVSKFNLTLVNLVKVEHLWWSLSADVQLLLLWFDDKKLECDAKPMSAIEHPTLLNNGRTVTTFDDLSPTSSQQYRDSKFPSHRIAYQVSKITLANGIGLHSMSTALRETQQLHRISCTMYKIAKSVDSIDWQWFSSHVNALILSDPRFQEYTGPWYEHPYIHSLKLNNHA